MRNSVKDIKLLHGDFIDLVQRIEARNVFSIAFNDIDEIIFVCIAFEDDISVVDLVFMQNCFNL